MTLREFTKEFLPLPDAELGPNYPTWRKEFPYNLRWNKVKIKDGYYSALWIFTGKYVEPIYKEVLEEKWERVHMGEIIDTEWRKLYT